MHDFENETHTLADGDWTQVRGNCRVEDDAGVVAGYENDIGHVVNAHGAQRANGEWLPFIYFERTGKYSLAWPEDLIFLGNAETGREVSHGQ